MTPSVQSDVDSITWPRCTQFASSTMRASVALVTTSSSLFGGPSWGLPSSWWGRQCQVNNHGDRCCGQRIPWLQYADAPGDSVTFSIGDLSISTGGMRRGMDLTCFLRPAHGKLTAWAAKSGDVSLVRKLWDHDSTGPTILHFIFCLTCRSMNAV